MVMGKGKWVMANIDRCNVESAFDESRYMSTIHEKRK
jgi:hypothetical protein